jgi:hypothetical protein
MCRYITQQEWTANMAEYLIGMTGANQPFFPSVTNRNNASVTDDD